MAHRLHAFIGEEQRLHDALAALGKIKTYELPHGFVLIPRSSVCRGLGISEEDDNYSLCESQVIGPVESEWARSLSHSCPIAFVETQYHGGTGEQSAIVWERGEVALGPLFHTNEPHELPDKPIVLSDEPINTALWVLGVRKGTAYDEFDALNLGAFRECC